MTPSPDQIALVQARAARVRAFAWLVLTIAFVAGLTLDPSRVPLAIALAVVCGVAALALAFVVYAAAIVVVGLWSTP